MMCKALFKKQLLEVNTLFIQNKKTGARRSALSVIGMIALYIVLFASFSVLFFMTAAILCAPLVEAGLDWLYFSVMGLFSVTLGVVGSIWSTYNTVYQAKDNDLLLSMPIPPSRILLVRLFGVWIWSLFFTAGVCVPALIVYWITVPVTAGIVLCGVALLFVLSVFVLALSCVLGWLVAKVAARVKNKSFVSVLLSLAFIALYYWGYSKAYQMLLDFLERAAAIGDSLRGYAYPLYLMGRMGAGFWPEALLFTALIGAVFALVWVLLSRSFLRLATAKPGAAKAVYREKTGKMRTPGGALLFKERKRFTASAVYMLNCGLSSVLLPILGIVALVKSAALNDFVAMLGELAGLVPPVVCALLALIGSMNMITAPSVSLEGKNLWLVQVLPVEPWQVLKAKLHLHLLVTEIPMVFGALCVSIALHFSAEMTVLAAALPAATVLFTAMFGLAVNLKIPNLKWTNEAVPIKQNANILLVMLGDWLLILLLALGYWPLSALVPPVAYLGLCLAVLAALSGALTVWLKKRGARILARL